MYINKQIIKYILYSMVYNIMEFVFSIRKKTIIDNIVGIKRRGIIFRYINTQEIFFINKHSNIAVDSIMSTSVNVFPEFL